MTIEVLIGRVVDVVVEEATEVVEGSGVVRLGRLARGVGHRGEVRVRVGAGAVPDAVKDELGRRGGPSRRDGSGRVVPVVRRSVGKVTWQRCGGRLESRVIRRAMVGCPRRERGILEAAVVRECALDVVR